MSPKKGKKSHECFSKECDEKFETQRLRIIHIKTKHGGRILCPYENCGSTLRSTYFQNHVNRFHKKRDRRVQCVHCNKQISRHNITCHTKLCTSDTERKFECEIEGCESMFMIKNNLTNHMSAVHRPPIKCPHRSCESFIKPANLVEHLKSVHENVRKTCGNCGKSISYRFFKKHLELCTASRERKFQCTYSDCRGAFTTKRGRSSHVSKVHKLPVKCFWENCKILVKSSNLPRHIRNVHENIQ